MSLIKVAHKTGIDKAKYVPHVSYVTHMKPAEETTNFALGFDFGYVKGYECGEERGFALGWDAAIEASARQ